VYSGVQSLRSDEAFPAWLFAMARHVRLRQFSRQSKSPLALAARPGQAASEDERDVLETLPAHGQDALDQIIDVERVEALREALTEMPARMQDCVRGRIVDGLKYSEIGAKLGISENTVAVHVHRGMNYLKSRVRRLFGDVRMHG
jgi:RNA polymerase sigma factor (sigma-70 family)